MQLIHRDPLVVIQQLFSRRDLERHISVAFKLNVNDLGERVYSDPCSSKDFETFTVFFTDLNFQERINKRHPHVDNKAPLAIMLYSDSTQLTQLANGQKAWLVYLTLANIHHEVRQAGKQQCIIPIAFLGAAETNEKDTV